MCSLCSSSVRVPCLLEEVPIEVPEPQGISQRGAVAIPNVERLLEGPSRMALCGNCLEITVTLSLNKAVILQALRLSSL